MRREERGGATRRGWETGRGGRCKELTFGGSARLDLWWVQSRPPLEADAVAYAVGGGGDQVRSPTKVHCRALDGGLGVVGLELPRLQGPRRASRAPQGRDSQKVPSNR